MKVLLQLGSSGRLPVLPEKRFPININHSLLVINLVGGVIANQRETEEAP